MDRPSSSHRTPADRGMEGTPGRRPSGRPVRVLLLSCVVAGSGAAPLAGQFLQTVVSRGGPLDSLSLGTITGLHVGPDGAVHVVSTEPGDATVLRVFDRSGRLVREAPGGALPDPDAWRPIGVWSDGPPADTLFLEAASGPRRGPFWVDLGRGYAARVDAPAGRVAYYRVTGRRAVSTGWHVIPERPSAADGGARTGPRPASIEAALGSDGRLWALLSTSRRRQEWAVFDPATTALEELVVLPAAFELMAVRGPRLIGIQRGRDGDGLHVLRRGS